MSALQAARRIVDRGGGGVQVAVAGHGRSRSQAFGRTAHGDLLRPDHLIPLYCTSKPVVAVGVLLAAEQGAIDLHRPVGPVLPWLTDPAMGSLTPSDLLTHRAGLDALSGVAARLLPRDARRRWVSGATPVPLSGDEQGYADFGAWFVLGSLLEATTREPFQTWLAREVLEPYGVAPGALTFTGAPDVASWTERTTPTRYVDDERVVPALGELSPDALADWNPDFGGVGTADGLCRFLVGVLGDLGGTRRVLSPEAARLATVGPGPVRDRHLERSVAFGHGFATGMDSEFGDRLSSTAFGHWSEGLSSLMVADPTTGVVVAVVSNTVTLLDHRRRREMCDLVDACIDQIGAGAVPFPAPA